MKHVVGILADVINNGLGLAYFVSVFRSSIFTEPFGLVF